MKNKRYIKLLLLLLVSLLIVVGCEQSTDDNSSGLNKSPYKQTEFILGTVVTIKIYDQDKEAVLDKAFEKIEYLDDRISLNKDNSEIDKINENAGKESVQVSSDIYKLIDAGKEYSSIADGSFDISVGPLTSLWHIGFDDARKPDQSEIDEILPLIDYTQVILNEEEQTVFLKNSGMQLDLGAIAKGFITDEITNLLKENDVTTAIIDLGGNIYVLGNNPSTGSPWTIGIQNPFLARGETVGKLPETNKSVVTSGIYERYLEVDGDKYHHILNPKDGYPFMNDIAGVSIISDQSIDGDALSTVLFSKGIKNGMEFINTMDGAEAIFISTDKDVYLTEGINDEFELMNEEFEIKELPKS